MSSIGKCLLYESSTSRAPLTCVTRIHKNYGSTGPFCLVFSKVHELIPSNITNAFIEFVTKIFSMIFLHTTNIKFFKYNYLIVIDNFSGFLMRKIPSFVGGVFMNMGNRFLKFLSFVRSFSFIRQFSLCLSKFFLIFFEKPGIDNFLTIRKCCKGFKTNIYSNNLRNFLKWLNFNFTREIGIPFANRGFSNGKCFGYSVVPVAVPFVCLTYPVAVPAD